MATISNKEIANAIFKATEGKTGRELHGTILNIVSFLNKKRLISKSASILTDLRKIVNKKEGIVEVKLTYAGKLTRDAKHHIEHALKKRYKARDVILHDSIDESLVGGFRIEAEDEVIDLSIKERVNKLKEHLIA